MQQHRGGAIKVKLTMIRKTQRWLHGELHKRGYALTEQLLSKILSGKYTYKSAKEILTVSESIIDEQQGID